MITKIAKGLLFLVPLFLTTIGTLFLYLNDTITKEIINWIARGSAIIIVCIGIIMILLVVYNYTKIGILFLFKIDVSNTKRGVSEQK